MSSALERFTAEYGIKSDYDRAQLQAVLDEHAAHLVEQQRTAHDTLRPYAHMGQPCKPEYDCGVRKVIDVIDPKALGHASVEDTSRTYGRQGGVL